MPWLETNPVLERQRFVKDVESGHWTMSELCVRYGISRITGYKWLDRFRQSGVAGLQDHSRAPRSCPHQTPQELVEQVLKENERYGWGARKILKRLRTRLPERSWPADDEAPTWKRDFPVSWVDDHLVTRRAFTRSLVGVSCASFAATASLAAMRAGAPARADWPVLELPAAAEMPVGSSRVFDYPAAGDACLLIRAQPSAGGPGPDGFAAFSQRCTHLGCPVVYRPSQGDLQCPCHAGYFSAADGRVLRGPAQRPLPRVELERRGEVLVAVGVRA
jgi:Rieske Fe-S protein/transposase